MRLMGHPERRHRRARGQALVEFALVIPIFMAIVVSLFELSFFLTTRIGLSNAGQDAAQLASEVGKDPDADFLILQLIEKDISAPMSATWIQSVSIFKTDLYGNNLGADTYTRSGSFQNTAHTKTVPYTSTSSGYPYTNRRNVIATGVDWIGVTITYRYAWVTPLPALTGLGSAPAILVQTNTSRLEPIQ
jgi:Flp pilus assembly protein TadG